MVFYNFKKPAYRAVIGALSISIISVSPSPSVAYHGDNAYGNPSSQATSVFVPDDTEGQLEMFAKDLEKIAVLLNGLYEDIQRLNRDTGDIKLEIGGILEDYGRRLDNLEKRILK